MVKKKVCRRCRYVYEEDVCPVCKSATPAISSQGRIVILDPPNSVIAKKVGISVKGEYAVKVR
jgi:DNA-directed RNA polymerase subunit E"